MATNADQWQRTQEIDLAVVQSFGAFSPGGRYLAAADDHTIEVRDSRGGGIVGTVEMVGVSSLAVSADGRTLVAADDEGNINAWSCAPVASLWTARLTMPPPSYAQVVYDVQFAAGGALAIASKPAGVNNTLVEIWPSTTGQYGRPEPLWQSVLLNADYQTFAPNPDGTRIILASDEGYWLVQSDNERLFIDGFFDTGDYAVVSFAPDGHRAAGVEAEGAWIYTVGEHAMREILDMELLDEPTDIAWSPEGRELLITSEDGLSICTRVDDDFAFQGTIYEGTGFEAAAFLDGETIAAKRGDVLLLFTRG